MSNVYRKKNMTIKKIDYENWNAFRSGIIRIEQQSSGSISLHVDAFIIVKVGWLRYCVWMHGFAATRTFFHIRPLFSTSQMVPRVPNIWKFSQFPTGDTIILYILYIKRDVYSVKTHTSVSHYFALVDCHEHGFRWLTLTWSETTRRFHSIQFILWAKAFLFFSCDKFFFCSYFFQ